MTFHFSWAEEVQPGDAVAVYTFASDADGTLTLLSTEGLPEQYMPNMAVIHLRENPTTGYQWEMEVDPAGVLALVNDAYTADQGAADIVGRGGACIPGYTVRRYRAPQR